jgi:biotin operon repressor
VSEAEHSLRQHVAALRDRGVSWSKIAATLGVSRQAAWERFSDPGAEV